MRKLIAAINMTLDGICDHTAVTPDQETHAHYSELLDNAGLVIYGRITYRMMESYWPEVVKNPTGNKKTDQFAVSMDKVDKLVFSKTLKQLEWDNARIATKSIQEEITTLKQQDGRDMYVCSPSLIIATLNGGLVDELQLCVHPVIATDGMHLFSHINERMELKLLKTKTFAGGAVLMYYQPGNH